MVHLISYDLLSAERPAAYEDIRTLVETNAKSFRKPLYSQWLVESDYTPKEWFELLDPVIDEGDRVLIVRVQSPYWGWLPKDIWDWLDRRL